MGALRKINDVVWGGVLCVVGGALVVEAVSNWTDGGAGWRTVLGGLVGAGIMLIGLDVYRRTLPKPTVSRPRKSDFRKPTVSPKVLRLRLESYAKDAKEVVSAAQGQADARRHAEVEPLHLLFALVEGTGAVKEAFNKCRVDPKDVAVETEVLLRKIPASGTEKSLLSRSMLDLLGRAEGESARDGGVPVSVKHLLLVCAQDESSVKEVFRVMGLSAPVLRAIIEKTSPVDRGVSNVILRLTDYSREAKQAVSRAQTLADELRHDKVSVLHLLFGLGGETDEELRSTVWDDIGARLENYPKKTEGSSSLSAEVLSILTSAEQLAKAESTKVERTHVWRALASQSTELSEDTQTLVEEAMPTRDTLQ